MQRRFNSCLLRFWDRADGTIRIEVEHIQEGMHVVVNSTAVALGWIDHHATADRANRSTESELDSPENDPSEQEKPP